VDQCERGAELAADVGKEGGFRTIDLGQRLGSAPFRFVSAGIGDGSGKLIGDQVDETAVVGVRDPSGA
jgi:hypothetical protein